MKHLVLQLQNLLDFFSVDDSSEHKKPKGVNKNVVATIIHGEYKDVLLKKKKCLGHLMNRIQNKNHRIGTYQQNFFILLR